MLIRYRWYRIQLPRESLPLEDIAANNPLTQNATFGFMHLEDKIGAPKFRFFWRVKVIVTKLDDEGTTYYEEVASVSFTDIAIVTIHQETFLRVENPGRNIRELLNAIESLVGLGFTSKPVTFDKATPTTLFNNVEATKLVGLKVVGAVIEEDLVARMEFASKQGMVASNMQLLKDLNYKVELAVYDLVYQGVRGQVAIASNGMIKVSGQLAPRLINFLEQDLPNLL